MSLLEVGSVKVEVILYYTTISVNAFTSEEVDGLLGGSVHATALMVWMDDTLWKLSA